MRDVRIGRDVAIKFLLEGERSPDLACARFLREACLQAQLEHPSIVPVHDIGSTDSGQLFFTMRRVRGQTLDAILRGLRAGDRDLQARFSQARLITAFNSICLTVAFAHEHGYVHRDIKPANIMLGDFGESYLLDWGLAKPRGQRGPLPVGTITEELPFFGTVGFIGTPGYMPPEQILNDRPLTEAVDVYALGAVLFEILSLRPLQEPGRERPEIFREAMDGVDARCSVRAPDRNVPPELEAICVRATARDPQDRFRTVLELSRAIERHLDGHRDETLRRELASAHAREARAEATNARVCAVEQEAHHRSLAMRSAGRALALDPGNSVAAETVAKLLSRPPRIMPTEVEAAQNTDLLKTRAKAREGAALAFGGALVLLLPLVLWLGVRDWTYPTWAFGMCAVCVGLGLYGRRHPENKLITWISMPLALVPCVLAGRVIGSIYFTPMLFMGFAIAGEGSRDIAQRRVSIVLACAACLIPQALEMAGIWAPSFQLSEDALCILPPALKMVPGRMMLSIAVVSVAMIVGPAFLANRMRASLTKAQDALLLNGWLIRQLLPEAFAGLGLSDPGPDPSTHDQTVLEDAFDDSPDRHDLLEQGGGQPGGGLEPRPLLPAERLRARRGLSQ